MYIFRLYFESKTNPLVRSILIFFFLLVVVVRATSQDYKFIYYLDKDLNSTSQEKASVIGKAYENDGALILNCFQKKTGKMTISARVKDSTLSTLHGVFRSYYDNMVMESEGNYDENEMHGLWKYWNDEGYITDSAFYDRGIRVAHASFVHYFKHPSLKQLFASGIRKTMYLYYERFTDSIKNTFNEKEVSIVNGMARTNYEAFFVGQRGLYIEYDSAGKVKTDSVFTREAREVEFKGGEDGWRDFLRKNLDPNVPVNNHAPDGKYTVILKFTVDENGRMEDIEAENDPGYGMVDSAIKVLKLSPRWRPQVRFGKTVKAFRRQPITYLVDSGPR